MAEIDIDSEEQLRGAKRACWWKKKKLRSCRDFDVRTLAKSWHGPCAADMSMFLLCVF
jgi:hypothetical protein